MAAFQPLRRAGVQTPRAQRKESCASEGCGYEEGRRGRVWAVNAPLNVVVVLPGLCADGAARAAIPVSALSAAPAAETRGIGQAGAGEDLS
jgi:hypothetical protein